MVVELFALKKEFYWFLWHAHQNTRKAMNLQLTKIVNNIKS